LAVSGSQNWIRILLVVVKVTRIAEKLHDYLSVLPVYLDVVVIHEVLHLRARDVTVL
jgi:hypothetical protein